MLALEGVERDRVCDRLDETALRPGGHLVRVRVRVKVRVRVSEGES